MDKIEYVENNWFNKKIKESENLNHDAHDLCLNGILFKRQRINKNSINWLCKVPNCSGSVTILKLNEKREAKVHDISFKPKYIMTDFELAAINSFKSIYPGIQSKGCLFHFYKSLMKKISDLGLKAEYEKNEELTQCFKLIFCLALITINSIDDQFEKLIGSMPDNDNVNKFMDYLVKT
ncbi:unnamed protein product, partial [Brachionus calyciflorus]